jgi:NADH:ubiquinone oxidoreductase subunit 2 (subunit N)
LFFIIYFEFIKVKNENNKFQNQLVFLFYINFFILFITLFLLIHSNNFLSLLFCIEIINMVLYFIIILQNKIFIKNIKSNKYITEIVLKYFLNNAFFTLIFLFGTSLIYFQTKSINFNFISNVLFEQPSILNNTITLLGILFIFISFFIKLGFLGFHKLVYEVYNGFNYYTYNFIGIFLKFYFFQIFAIMYIETFYSIYSTKLFFILVLFTIISLLISTI